MAHLQEPIYKGATRPAMKAGVPLMALLVVFMPVVMISAWGAILLSKWVAIVAGLTLVPLYGWMRWTTARDDQRLTQLLMKARLARANRNRRFWRTRSYAAYRPREQA